jgi:hypothetical protein
MHDDDGPEHPTRGVAAMAGAAMAVVCCAAGPRLVAAASSLTLGLVLAVGAGLAALVVLTALVIGARRRAQRPGIPQAIGRCSRACRRSGLDAALARLTAPVAST